MYLEWKEYVCDLEYFYFILRLIVEFKIHPKVTWIGTALFAVFFSAICEEIHLCCGFFWPTLGPSLFPPALK